MAASHSAAVRDIGPGAADKVELLDPDGGDIVDPVGLPPDEFAQVVRRIRECIERRVKDL